MILDMYHAYCVKWDILLNELNPKKTKNMFGKGTKPIFTVTINGADIPWVDQWKYLCITLKSGRRFGC